MKIDVHLFTMVQGKGKTQSFQAVTQGIVFIAKKIEFLFLLLIGEPIDSRVWGLKGHARTSQGTTISRP
jgi:hypothetical protein